MIKLASGEYTAIFIWEDGFYIFNKFIIITIMITMVSDVKHTTKLNENNLFDPPRLFCRTKRQLGHGMKRCDDFTQTSTVSRKPQQLRLDQVLFCTVSWVYCEHK